MATKQIFTKTQAVSVLVQIKEGKQISIVAPVDPKHNLFRHSCDELEAKLGEFIDPSGIAGVVEDPTPI